MANYNKSFNFRNGVQVDEDDLIVRGSLVGIGTTVPRAELDVYGTIRSTGIITANNVYVAGIATFNDIQIGTGITIIGNSGTIAAKFFGDGAGLYNIPTSQWVDVDPAVFAPLPPPPGAGTGYTSIYAAGTVGIGTTIPRYYLQVGGDPNLSQNGVGIDSVGNINISGIVTAESFVGSGLDITLINASNISSGTLNNSRLPSDISVSGVITAVTFNGQINAGTGVVTSLSGTNLNYTGIGTVATLNSENIILTNLSGITGIMTNLSFTNLSGNIGTFAQLTGVNAEIQNFSGTIGTITNLTVSNLSGAIGTITSLNSVTGIITNITSDSGTIINLSGTNLNYSGVGTVGVLGATGVNAGFMTAIRIAAGNVRLGFVSENLIDTSSGDLILNSAGGLVDINNNVDILGTTILQGNVTVNTGIVPDTSTGAYLGQQGKEFLESWIGDIKIAVGVGNSNKIETISKDLILDSNTNKVVIDSDLNVTGVTTLTGNLTLGSGIEPTSDLGIPLGTASKRFSSSQVGAIRIGVAQTNQIDTLSGTDLIFDSASGTTRINDNLFVSGIGSFGGEITVGLGLVPDESKGAYIGISGKPFDEAYINDITIGVSGATEINTTSGNLILNASSGQTQVFTNLSVSGFTTVSSAASFTQGTYFVGLSTFYTGLVPNQSKGAYIGTSGKPFSEAYFNEIRIGVGATNKIDTRDGDLLLDSNTNIVRVDGNLTVNENATLRNKTFFGDNNFVVIDPISNSVGIGTTLPSERLQVVNDSLDLRVEFISRNNLSEIGVGLREVGSGSSVGVIGYANSTFNLTNEGVGGFNFTIHSGTPGVGTEGFSWIYGQTSQQLMSLDYNGKLTLGNLFSGFTPTITSFPATVAISSASGIGKTALYVKGETILEGNTNITGIVSFISDLDPANTLSYDPSSGNFRIKNLIVTGTTSGVTATGSGVNVSDDIFSFGSTQNLNFAKGLRVVTDEAPGSLAISVTPDQYGLLQVGIGTTAPRSVLDVGRSGGINIISGTELAPFVILPRISTSERNSFTGIVGSMIYNTTNNRFELFMPGGWCGVATVA